MPGKKIRSGPGAKKVLKSEKTKTVKGTTKASLKKRDKNPGYSKQPDSTLKKIRPSGKREESFFELVYEVARQIPYGRVTSYGAIAACLGTKLSARMVGWAMNGADKINPIVPAHRVVNRVGLLSGKHHFKPPGKMEKLLKKEGILVKEDVIVNFREKFWDPAEEIL
jgi:methylated-DNA-protein-cysteine methyltransferase-like protein